MTLDEFITHSHSDLEAFKASYLRDHEKNPADYPLELDKDDSGLWFEFYAAFRDEEPS